MSSSLERLWIRCILIVFVVTGSLYATLTPVFEASDELWHYPMIQHLSEGNPLPVQVTDPALAGPWKQEASQPPLYYYMGALLTFWIDTSDMPIVRDLNPHVNNGEIRPDGNFNLAVHNNPNLNPWVGTLLAVRVVRFASVLLGVFTVWFTYLIGKEFDPKRPEIALLGAALAGFTPMFLFISGAVNNDNLAIPLASLGILLMIRLIRSQQAVSFEVSEASSSFTAQLLRPMPFGSLLFIGVVIGGAVLTKQGSIGLIPLAWGTAFIASWLAVRPAFFESKTTFSQGVNLLIAALLRSFFALAIVFLPILIVAGWWYWRNIQLYGDLLGWSAFIAVLGERETPAPIAQLWDERWGFMLSYWGLFGGVNVPMATWVYRLLNTILVISIPGGGFYLFQLWRGHQADGPTATKLSSKPILLRLIAQLLDLVVTYFGLVVCILFSGAIVYGLIQWATTTWSSQGRLVFTAMSALNLLWAAALVGWLGDANRRRLALALGGGMVLIGIAAPFLTIRPAYRPAPPNDSTLCYNIPDNWTCIQPNEAVFSGLIRLNQAQVSDRLVKPGDQLEIELDWETVNTSDRDWSVFVHVVDPVLERPIAQRDMYLGQGLLASSFLPAGERLSNLYVLTVPDGAIAPSE
ncbi:MAG: glycosyltransferase family 39 protein, partial [Chloroflexota bacterium]